MGAVGGLAVLGLALTGCSSSIERGMLPGQPGTTNHTDDLTSLWTHAWLVLLILAALVWGLTIWCVIAYRRRKGDTGYPPQYRYNLPIEVLYTVVPVILVVGFFAATVPRLNMTEQAAAAPSDHSVTKLQVIGKQWSWDVNYFDPEGRPYAHEPAGEQADYVSGSSYDESQLPTMYLPANQPVEIKIDSRDVAHSFWVPEFLYKKDAIPGVHNNYWHFTPQREGTYQVKCAELCGEYHSMMLMQVKVVSPDEYQAHIQQLSTDPETSGALGLELNREQNLPGYRSPDEGSSPSPSTEQQ